MNILICLIFLSLTIFMYKTEAYRILGIFPLPSRSHQLMYDAIFKGLARRGHQIDVMTLFPLKKPMPNYNVVINLENKVKNVIDRYNIKSALELGDDCIREVSIIYGNDLCKHLAHPELQKIIKNPPTDPPYDLLMTESFTAHCFIGLGYALKLPVILVSSTVESPWLDQLLGQPINPSYFTTYFTRNVHPMFFFQRLHNTLMNYITNFRFRRFTDDVQNAYMKKYIDPNIPPLQELEKNVTLALVNSHHSFHGIRPLSPKVIEIAGIHVLDHYEKMPQELEKWMNESTSGVIYFTLSSMVSIETLPQYIISAFYTVFTKLAPVKVLMRIGNKEDLLAGLPNNVRITSWIPQVAVLAHKNTRVFMTQGGLMSVQEALTFEVPMVGIPLFGDQFSNIEFCVRKNMALKLDFHNLTEDSIYEALNEVLHNPKYKKAAKIASTRFLDRPLSAIDTAMYWIEYGIRHGPNALKSPAVDMPWWQSALLDVYAFLLISIILIICLIVSIARWCLNIFLTFKIRRRIKIE